MSAGTYTLYFIGGPMDLTKQRKSGVREGKSLVISGFSSAWATTSCEIGRASITAPMPRRHEYFVMAGPSLPGDRDAALYVAIWRGEITHEREFQLLSEF